MKMKKRRLLAGLFASVLLAGSMGPAVPVKAGEAGMHLLGETKGAEAEENGFVIENGVLTRYNGSGGNVTIPESVTSIGDHAFESCSSLTSITIPNTVKSIGEDAFAFCSNLVNVTISEGVTHIGEDAFWMCESLVSVTIPKSVKSIGENAFYDCRSLTSITIPKGVTSIGEGAFIECSSLRNVIIPEGVTNIGECLFWSCSSLTSVTIPEGVTSIGERAFYECSSLTSVTLPGSLKSIGNSAFQGCKSLKSITIPEGMTSIGSYSFFQCGLTSVTIPKGVKSIGDSAFDGCSGLKSVTISEGVTNIGEYAFANCSSLKSVTIPKSVKSIGEAGFGGCSSLKSVTIPKSVKNIGDDAFYKCSKKLVIYCMPGSAAEKYAKKNYIKYQFIKDKNSSTITAKNITRVYGDKPFSIGAKASGNGKLTYKVINTKVASISKKGKITIKGCGRTKIRITAAANGKYKKAEKTITLTVKPKQASLSSVKSKKSGTLTVAWKRDKKASGYLIWYSTDKNFKKNVQTAVIPKNSATSKKLTKLKGGKTYYVRMCAYAKADGKKIKGSYTKTKSVKVKK